MADDSPSPQSQSRPLRLNFRDASGGSPQPVVVCLHALGCDLRMWDQVTERLAGHCRVLRCDLRGHGDSPSPSRECSIGELAGDVDALLNELEISRAVIVGASVGGMVALALGRDFSPRVGGLVLVGTAARIGSRETWQTRIETVRSQGISTVADQTVARWFTAEFAAAHPDRIQESRARLSRSPIDGYLATCAALRDADYRASLPSGIPSVVVHGEKDLAVPTALGRDLAAALGCRFVPLENTAHLSPVECPDQVAAAIVDFLRENRLT